MSIRSKVYVGLSVLALSAALGSFPAQAESIFKLNAYSEPAFKALEMEKQDGIIVVSKEGCPVCAKQVPAVEALLKKPEYAGIKVQQLNFSDPLAATKFKATNQSTLIVYKDGAEVSRTVGLVDEKAIEAELKKAL